MGNLAIKLNCPSVSGQIAIERPIGPYKAFKSQPEKPCVAIPLIEIEKAGSRVKKIPFKSKNDSR